MTKTKSVLKPAEFLVLLALSGGDSHGYGIKKEVARLSQGGIDLEPGHLYRLIARFEDRGLIEETDDRPAVGDDERRRYYTLTQLGREALSREASRMEAIVGLAEFKSALGDGG